MAVEIKLFGEGQPDNFHERVFDAIPNPVFVVDEKAHVRDLNAAAGDLLGDIAALREGNTCGAWLRCVHATAPAHGCGDAAECAQCGVRTTIQLAQSTPGRHHATERVRRNLQGEIVETEFLISSSTVPGDNERLVLVMLHDLREHKQAASRHAVAG